ncbi:UNVERIFIED_CONTAM: hypothetical protein PYX00_005323 [Menopon gallinae]|uniref:HIT domain-containing protein n=1 Tax=Menopon gallinae TaxID=328185 RepID=A0AAW2HS56_9NEOP
MSGKSKVTKTSNHWSHGLIKSLENPDLKVYEDELVTVIKDVYPKATFHYLVCPKADIKSLKDIKQAHLSLLQHMTEVGEKIAEKHEGNKFLIGYHAIPSMIRLHLHVISDDFNSPSLKSKKHWNSFNTDFFISSESLISQLESGKIKQMSSLKAKELLNMDLKCHKCDYKPKNMPDLKKHILKHL